MASPASGGTALAGDLLPARPDDEEARPVCGVTGCQVPLLKPYDKKCRTCAAHRRALNVVITGQGARFCQKCGCFQLLAEFDGNKRSCRVRLTEHNKRQRRLRALRLKGRGGAEAEEDAALDHGSAASGGVSGSAAASAEVPEVLHKEGRANEAIFSTVVEPALDALALDQLVDLRVVAAVQSCLSDARQELAPVFVPPPLDERFTLGSDDENDALVWLGYVSDEAPVSSAIGDTVSGVDALDA